MRLSSQRKDAQSDGFVLFIDEAGDPGLKAVAPMDANGSSEWFILGAVLFRRRYEVDAVEWVKSIRRDINAVQGHDLHFRKLSATKRLRACELASKLPIRAFAVVSHKVNMRGYHNPRAAKQQNADWFYNWCLRLLLERVTAAVDLSNQRAGVKNTPIRVVMAERGGHSYSKTAVYIRQLQQQARHGTGVLQKRQIVPNALDWGQVEYIPASQSAGAQLADVVASAFYSAFRRPIVADAAAPAKLLRPIMARENGRVADFGLALFPAPHALELDPEFKDVFRFYGHIL